MDILIHKLTIELKRAIHKACSFSLVDEIVSADKFLEFYQSVFETFSLSFSPEIIKEKQSFVIATTFYYIIDRLTLEKVRFVDNKYDVVEKNIQKDVSKLIDIYFKLRNESESSSIFVEKYAKHFNISPKDFSWQIKHNSITDLSDFEKSLKMICSYIDKINDKKD